MGLAFWMFGLLVTALPIFASVAPEPAAWARLFSAPYSWGHEKELLYVGVAVGAVAFVDGLEALVKSERDTRGRILVILMLMLCLGGMMVLLMWYPTALPVDVDPLTNTRFALEHERKLNGILIALLGFLPICIGTRFARLTLSDIKR